MIFVGIITLTACYQLFFRYLDQARAGAAVAEAFPFKLNAWLVATVAMIAIVILIDSAIKWYGYLVLKKPMTSTEVSMFPQGPAATTKEGNIDVGL
jgi:carbon starvation protein